MCTATLHAANPGQAEERLFIEPVMAGLGWIVLEKEACLLLCDNGFQWVVDSRTRSVALPLKDLVTEHEMVTELGRQEFCDQSMVLVGVVALRAEHHLWIASATKIPQVILDTTPMRRREAIRNIEHREFDVRPRAESLKSVPLFRLAFCALSGQH